MPSVDWQRARLADDVDTAVFVLNLELETLLTRVEITRLRFETLKTEIEADRARLENLDYGDPEIRQLEGTAFALCEAHAQATLDVFRSIRPYLGLEGEPLEAAGAEEITEAPAKDKHPGGRPPQYDWMVIDALTTRDVVENDYPQTIADLIRRTQAACREAGIAEPCEETLRPRARVLFNTLWRGQPPLRQRPLPAKGFVAAKS